MKIWKMWLWQLPQLLMFCSPPKHGRKSPKPLEHEVFKSEMSCHTVIIKRQHFTYSYIMDTCRRIQVLRMPFPSAF